MVYADEYALILYCLPSIRYSMPAVCLKMQLKIGWKGGRGGVGVGIHMRVEFHVCKVDTTWVEYNVMLHTLRQLFLGQINNKQCL